MNNDLPTIVMAMIEETGSAEDAIKLVRLRERKNITDNSVIVPNDVYREMKRKCQFFDNEHPNSYEQN